MAKVAFMVKIVREKKQLYIIFMALDSTGHNFCMLFFIVELVSLLMSDGELKIAWNLKEKKNIRNKRTNKICQKN